MRVGYARVSTDDQTLDLQRDALKRAKCKEIYEEHASGKNTARPQLEACLKSLRDGDTLIVWRLDRLGRSLADLIRLTHELKARGVGFASLTEQIDTRSPSGQLVFHVFGALAEFERNLIRERTLAGLKAQKAQCEGPEDRSIHAQIGRHLGQHRRREIPRGALHALPERGC
jgi:DNA invertase Pin-like site-specific DNA recombinase